MCHLQELYMRYKDKGLVVLSFNGTDDRQRALGFIRDSGLTFPAIVDTSDAGKKVYEEGYTGSLPMNYIIDRNGTIVDGWYYDDEEDHVKAIAALQKLGGELGEAIHADVESKAGKAAADVTVAAQRLFDAIRAADYDRDWVRSLDWKQFPAKDVRYHAGGDGRSAWVRWVCKKFKTNPIAEVQFGKVFANAGGWPTVHYELQLKDGEVLQGDLPFKWDAKSKQWIGQLGLDWHLQKAP